MLKEKCQKKRPESEEIVKKIEKLLDLPPEFGYLAGSLASFIAGVVLLFDDVKDLGKFSTPDHPSPLHHWQYGIPLMLAGIAGMGCSLLSLVSKLPPQVRARIRKLPPGLLEQGAPPELVDAFR